MIDDHAGQPAHILWREARAAGQPFGARDPLPECIPLVQVKRMWRTRHRHREWRRRAKRREVAA